MTASGIPFVNPNIPTSLIKGEVWEVDEEGLKSLDSLEGYNPDNHEGSWYKRTPIEVQLDEGKTVEASIYFNNDSGRKVVESGDFNNHSY